MIVIDKVDGEHGIAGEQELGQDGLKAHRHQRNADGGVGIAR